jgi:hypothetical protein
MPAERVRLVKRKTSQKAHLGFPFPLGRRLGLSRAGSLTKSMNREAGMALNSRPDHRGRHLDGVAGFGKQLAVRGSCQISRRSSIRRIEGFRSSWSNRSQRRSLHGCDRRSSDSLTLNP